MKTRLSFTSVTLLVLAFIFILLGWFSNEKISSFMGLALGVIGIVYQYFEGRSASLAGARTQRKEELRNSLPVYVLADRVVALIFDEASGLFAAFNSPTPPDTIQSERFYLKHSSAIDELQGSDIYVRYFLDDNLRGYLGRIKNELEATAGKNYGDDKGSRLAERLRPLCNIARALEFSQKVAALDAQLQESD